MNAKTLQDAHLKQSNLDSRNSEEEEIYFVDGAVGGMDALLEIMIEPRKYFEERNLAATKSARPRTEVG